METKDHDTDPSTPSARRLSTAPPPRGPDDTDPGLGPGGKTVRPTKRPISVVVPPPSALAHSPQPPPSPSAGGDSKKDSVELLLEGMAEQRLDRTKTMPQTDGQASAAYHAEHDVHPGGRQAPEEGPKVLVDPPITVRVTRAARDAAMAASALESTVMTPTYGARRVLLALLAGVLVVVGIFLVLQLAVRRPLPESPRGGLLAVPAVPAGAAPAEPPPSAPQPGGTALPVAPDPLTAPPTASSAILTPSDAPPAAAPSGPASRAWAAVSAPPLRVRPAATTPTVPRKRGRAGAPSANDLGEFKTTF